MEKDNIVLIISHSADIHVDELEKQLLLRNQTWFRLNLDEFPRDYKISNTTSSNSEVDSQFIHIPSGRLLNNKNIKSVWVRKKAPFQFVSDDLNLQEQKFAEQETEHLLNGFLFSLDCYWMSHPKSMRASQWKMEQLSRARKYGFKVPDTLLSNDPEEVTQFYQQHNKRIITKPLSGSSLAADMVDPQELVTAGVATVMVSDEQMLQIEAVKEFPCHFQAYVEKQFELRATVIGDRIFTAKIDSQSDERTRIDFRDFSAEIAYEAWTLPDEIASRCIEYVHSYGLQYGAIDLIYTPDNEFVFLENNPGGQFWFVEQLVPELKMMECLANCLIEARI